MSIQNPLLEQLQDEPGPAQQALNYALALSQQKPIQNPQPEQPQDEPGPAQQALNIALALSQQKPIHPRNISTILTHIEQKIKWRPNHLPPKTWAQRAANAVPPTTLNTMITLVPKEVIPDGFGDSRILSKSL
jgi:hypothetical protein